MAKVTSYLSCLHALICPAGHKFLSPSFLCLSLFLPHRYTPQNAALGPGLTFLHLPYLKAYVRAHSLFFQVQSPLLSMPTATAPSLVTDIAIATTTNFQPESMIFPEDVM